MFYQKIIDSIGTDDAIAFFPSVIPIAFVRKAHISLIFIFLRNSVILSSEVSVLRELYISIACLLKLSSIALLLMSLHIFTALFFPEITLILSSNLMRWILHNRGYPILSFRSFIDLTLLTILLDRLPIFASSIWIQYSMNSSIEDISYIF